MSQIVSPSTATMSSDTVSPKYPERPIRPMPKRKIRSRLSEEQAGSIEWPLVVSSSSPSFGSPQSQNERSTFYPAFSNPDDPSNHSPHHASDHYCDCGDHYRSEFESEEEDVAPLHSVTASNVNGKYSYKQHHSPTSSADGYESFENTNNKKKRKIPITGLGQLEPAPDHSKNPPKGHAADVFLPYGAEDASRQPHDFPVSAGTGIGISGAGRGRHAKGLYRSNDVRRPLATSANAANAGAGDGGPQSWSSNSSANDMGNEIPAEEDRTDNTDRDGTGSSKQGIIATAMSKAAGKGMLKGQENLSLLQRQQQSSTNGEGFTFQCPSDSAGKLSLPHRPNPASVPSTVQTSSGASTGATRPVTAHGTQTGSSAPAGPMPSRSPPVGSSQQQQAPQNGPHGEEPMRKPRRPGREYAIQARQRRMQQEYDNYHNPPRREDVWICEFCEYEAIFGVQPTALVRQYEVKDYKERKIAEERRRLLEKAKAKSRKNKKASKGGSKHANNAAPHNSGAAQRYESPYDDDSPHQPDEGEEYIDDDYNDAVGPPDNHEAYENPDYDPRYIPPPVTGPPAGGGGGIPTR